MAGAPPPPPPSKSDKKPVDYVEVRPQHVKSPAIQVQPPLQHSAAAVKREYEYKTIMATEISFCSWTSLLKYLWHTLAVIVHTCTSI